ncbi:hypothetical protein [Pseudoalteromonas sp. GB56]
MNFNSSAITGFVRKHTKYFSLEQRGESSVYPVVLIIPADYVIEQRKYFNISKRKDLTSAIELFVNQNNPVVDGEYWTTVRKGIKGYFVTISYITKELVQQARKLQPRGGLIIPETALIRQLGMKENTHIDGYGNYVDDDNYGMQFVRGQNSILSALASGERVSRNDFEALIVEKFSEKQLLQSLRKIHFGRLFESKFTLGHSLILTLLVLGYLGLSSAFIYWQHQSVLETFSENKQLTRAVQQKETELVDLETTFVKKNKPFENYGYTFLVFSVLKDIGIYYELSGMTIADGEIQIAGISDDAGELFRALSENESVSDLRYVMPIRKSGARDSFSIGFKVKQ